jgi:C_GCAxxG_C_C family probable redox protein
MSKTDIAVQKFTSGYNCAQSVLSSFSNDLGLDENTPLKIACGFGAGMGRKQEVCGAVSGGRESDALLIRKEIFDLLL